MNNKYLTKLTGFIKKVLMLDCWESPSEKFIHEDDRLSVHTRRDSKKNEYKYQSHCHMFSEDMAINLYMNDDTLVSVEPADNKNESIITRALSGSIYNSPLLDSLNKFLYETSQVLFSDGIVFYEIVCKKDSNGELEELNFILIHSPIIFKLFNYYYQVVTWSEAKRSRTKAGVVRMPSEKILCIELPKKIGSKKSIDKLLKRLHYLKSQIIPDFIFEYYNKGEECDSDLEKFEKTLYQEIGKLTKVFGWNQRCSGKYMTDYYHVYNYLRYKEISVLIRNIILLRINNALDSNLNVKISIKNDITIEKIKEIRKKIEMKNISFKEILESFRSNE